jgi:hypothetical protein
MESMMIVKNQEKNPQMIICLFYLHSNCGNDQACLFYGRSQTVSPLARQGHGAIPPTVTA